MSQQSPIDTREPLVLLDFTRSTLTSQPLVFVFTEQSLDDTFADSRRRRVIRERRFVAKDIRKSRMSIRSFERCTAVQHFENENSKRPPTH